VNSTENDFDHYFNATRRLGAELNDVKNLLIECQGLANGQSHEIERWRETVKQYRDEIDREHAEVKRLSQNYEWSITRGKVWVMEIERLRADIETWGQIWNDAEMLTARAEALRDGTADLGQAGMTRPTYDELEDQANRMAGTLSACSDVIERLRAELTTEHDIAVDTDHELDRLRTVLAKGRALVNDMDLRMPDQATEDSEGWINSYRIPVGPWHRILGWARGEADTTQ
jgi:uncharacterized protein YukE